MEKPMTLCGRCEKHFFCLLNYDGVPCRKNRTVEPTNYDRIVSKTPEELAEFLSQDGDCPPERMYPNGCPNCDRVTPKVCYDCWLDWLKQEATE